MSNYIEPDYNKDFFCCPYCNVNSSITKYDLITDNNGFFQNNASFPSNSYYLSVCNTCEKELLWIRNIDDDSYSIIYPNISISIMPNEDLPPNVIELFNEAKDVLNASPRSSCVLLRIALEKYLYSLGYEGSLNKMIHEIIDSGDIPPKIAMSLDIIRLVGNDNAHSIREINNSDTKEMAIKLFKLINLVAQYLVTDVKEVKKTFNNMPENKKSSIKDRDKK